MEPTFLAFSPEATCRELALVIRSRFAEYLRIVEPDAAALMDLAKISFSEPLRLEFTEFCPNGSATIVASVPDYREAVTVIAAVVPHALSPEDGARMLAEHLIDLELRYGQPVLASILSLKGGRASIHLSSGLVAHLGGVELARVYYSVLNLGSERAEPYLDRPEPLAWLLSLFMESRDPYCHGARVWDKVAKIGEPALEEQLALLRGTLPQPSALSSRPLTVGAK